MLYIIIPIVVLLLIFLFAGYVKAPPNKAAIITGLSKNPRVLLGKSGFKVPFFERVDWLEVGQIIFQLKILSISKLMPLPR